jgi:hypothetical protein
MAVRLPLVARRAHKWLALLVGVQALIWAATGVYMTAVDIDTIHGDHFIRSEPPLALGADDLADPLAAAALGAGARSVRLSSFLGVPVYVVTSDSGSRLVDARDGKPMPRPTPQQIAAAADHWFTGPERLAGIRLLREVPGELRGRKPPLWRADFDGWNKPTLYLSPETGELVSRRHELWRIFDFAWMLHIMDYEERENVNNLALRIVAWSSLAMMLAGGWLLLATWPRRRKPPRR